LTIEHGTISVFRVSERPLPSESETNGTEGLPARFGKYTLLRRLARGGMAELFLALRREGDADFEKLLVIKRILPSLSRDRTFIGMLRHEARVAATLSHPNIVQIFDAGQEDGQFFIAMEHIHGADLRAVIRQMKKKGILEFPLEHAVAIALGTCAGLSYAHDKRDLDGAPLEIVHRDISPQNIVLTFTGDVKIVDFGIAKSKVGDFSEETLSGKLKGKVPYMSPEQARGEPLDARSDLFAVGTMLFELTTGKRLFKGQSEFETLRLICDREYPRPSEVRPDYPPELERIVMRALAKDRALRYPNGREMQADLEAFVRRSQLVVSSLSVRRFMQSLFDDKLEVARTRGGESSALGMPTRTDMGTAEGTFASAKPRARLRGRASRVFESAPGPRGGAPVGDGAGYGAEPHVEGRRSHAGLIAAALILGLLVAGGALGGAMYAFTSKLAEAPSPKGP
jgi:serine/threonine protein kinase